MYVDDVYYLFSSKYLIDWRDIIVHDYLTANVTLFAMTMTRQCLVFVCARARACSVVLHLFMFECRWQFKVDDGNVIYFSVDIIYDRQWCPTANNHNYCTRQCYTTMSKW